jgi:hypothetical protein
VSPARIVIHRDKTFDYEGRTYRALNNGPGWGYEIVEADTMRKVDDGYFTLQEIREKFTGPQDGEPSPTAGV